MLSNTACGIPTTNHQLTVVSDSKQTADAAAAVAAAAVAAVAAAASAAASAADYPFCLGFCPVKFNSLIFHFS